MTLLEESVRLLRRTEMADMSCDDARVFARLRQGDFNGVPFLEGETKAERTEALEAWRSLFRRVGPTSLEEMSHVFALHWSREKTDRYYAALKDSLEVNRNVRSVLEETRGVILFDDQIERLLRELAGFPKLDAVRLAKCFRKSMACERDESRARFQTGCRASRRFPDPTEGQNEINRLWQQLVEESRTVFPRAEALHRATTLYSLLYRKVTGR